MTEDLKNTVGNEEYKSNLPDVADDEFNESSEIKVDERYVKKLKEEVAKWRNRAKDNLGAAQKAKDADEMIKESQKRSQQALEEVNAMRVMAEKRLVSAEIKSIASEMGLKKVEYAKLADQSKVKVLDNGEVGGVREMLEELKTADPDLFKMVTTTNINFTSVTPADRLEKNSSLMSMSDKEYKQKERDFLRKHRR